MGEPHNTGKAVPLVANIQILAQFAVIVTIALAQTRARSQLRDRTPETVKRKLSIDKKQLHVGLCTARSDQQLPLCERLMVLSEKIWIVSGGLEKGGLLVRQGGCCESCA